MIYILETISMGSNNLGKEDEECLKSGSRELI